MIKIESIDEIITEIDKLISDREVKYLTLDRIYNFKDGKLPSLEYENYKIEKDKLNEKINKNFEKLFLFLDKEIKEVRSRQAALLDLKQENLNLKFNIPRKIALEKRRIEHSLIEKRIEVPKLLDFPFKENMYIAGDEEVHLLHKVFLRLLYALPIGKLEFYVFDALGLGKAVENFNSLFSNEKIFPNKKVITSKNELKETQEKLLEYIENLRHTKFNSEQKNWEEYNRFIYSKGEYEKILPYKVFLFMNAPDGMGEEEFNNFRKLLQNNTDCGVLVLFSFNEVILNAEETRQQGKVLELKKCIDNSYPLQKRLSNVDDLGLKNLSMVNISEKTPERKKLQEKLDIYLQELKNKEEQFDKLNIFLAENKRFDRNSKDELKIPVGFDAISNEIVEISIGDDPVHYLIGGGTGSGKSTLIHALVLSACNRYSPDELNLYIMDFKEGVEANVYANPEILPQASLVATDADVNYGLTVLKHLTKLIKERAKEFKENGCKDLKGYREKFPETKIPRVVAIIDEFQVLLQSSIKEKVTEEFITIAKQGRSHGIHMILATQTLKGLDGFTSIGSQILGRIVLKSSAEDSKSLFGSSANNEEAAKIAPPYAILNTKGGYIEYNKKFLVPFHENKITQKIKVIKTSAINQGIKTNNKIFDGNENPKFPDIATFENNGNLEIKLGKVNNYKADDFMVIFEPEKNENLLILGHNKDIKNNLMKSILLSIRGNKDYELVYIGKNNLIKEKSDKYFKNLVSGGYQDKNPDSNIEEFLTYIKDNNRKKVIILDETDITFLKIASTGKDGELKKYLNDEVNEQGNVLISFFTKNKDANNNGLMEISRKIIGFGLNEESARSVFEDKIESKDIAFAYNKEIQCYFKPYMEEVEDDE